MSKIEPRVRVILVLVLLLGIIWLDLVLDIIIYAGIVITIFFASPKKLLPILLPIPISLAIVGMNLLFLGKLGLISSFRFYFASAIGLEYSTISSAEEITSGIQGVLGWIGIKGGEMIYAGVSSAKRMMIKDLSLKKIPQQIVDLINSDRDLGLADLQESPIRTHDILLLISAIAIIAIVCWT